MDDAKAVIPIYDHGLLYGIGLFETFRTYGGKPFLLERHLLRMKKGLTELGICYEPNEAGIRASVRELLEANGLKDGYIRFTVTAGEQALGLPTGGYEHPNVIIYVKPLPPAAASNEVKGRSLQLLRLRRNTPEGTERFKSLHYMNNILGKREMQQYSWASGAEGFFLDQNGFLAEGLVSNLFLVKKGVLYTPSVDTGILPGITRGKVMELALEKGLGVEEGLYRLEDLYQADEAFVTNSIQEIVPVTAVYDPEGSSIPIGKKAGPGTGAVTWLLQEEYGKAVAAAIRDGDGSESSHV